MTAQRNPGWTTRVYVPRVVSYERHKRVTYGSSAFADNRRARLRAKRAIRAILDCVTWNIMTDREAELCDRAFERWHP